MCSGISNGPVGKVKRNNFTTECEVNGTECYDGWMLVIYLFVHSGNVHVVVCVNES